MCSFYVAKALCHVILESSGKDNIMEAILRIIHRLCVVAGTLFWILLILGIFIVDAWCNGVERFCITYNVLPQNAEFSQWLVAYMLVLIACLGGMSLVSAVFKEAEGFGMRMLETFLCFCILMTPFIYNRILLEFDGPLYKIEAGS